METFSLFIQTFLRSRKQVTITESTKNCATENCNLYLKRSWKFLFIDIILENVGWNYYHEKLETNHEVSYIKGKFLKMMTFYKLLKKSWKLLLKGNVFENVNWIYYHLKPKTNPKHGICEWKIFRSSGVLYIIRRVCKCRLLWYHFLKHWHKLLPSKTSDTVYANKKI